MVESIIILIIMFGFRAAKRIINEHAKVITQTLEILITATPHANGLNISVIIYSCATTGAAAEKKIIEHTQNDLENINAYHQEHAQSKEE